MVVSWGMVLLATGCAEGAELGPRDEGAAPPVVPVPDGAGAGAGNGGSTWAPPGAPGGPAGAGGTPADVRPSRRVGELADALLIDGSVYRGRDWSGAPYEGVWAEPFAFRMDRYPRSWAFGLVHAARLARAAGLSTSPNALLATAIKESRLGLRPAGETLCSRTPQPPADPFPNADGCFQIEEGTAYLELSRVFSRRFAAPHHEVVGDDHFASAALAAAHYQVFTLVMLELHHPAPLAFFSAHPAREAELEVLSAAYNRGLWWDGLSRIFEHCAARPVTECFGGMQIAVDHAGAISAYAAALDESPPFDALLAPADLEQYWQAIRLLYPKVTDEDALSALQLAFERQRATHGEVRFATSIHPLLDALDEVLPVGPTSDEARRQVCALGYLPGERCR